MKRSHHKKLKNYNFTTTPPSVCAYAPSRWSPPSFIKKGNVQERMPVLLIEPPPPAFTGATARSPSPMGRNFPKKTKNPNPCKDAEICTLQREKSFPKNLGFLQPLFFKKSKIFYCVKSMTYGFRFFKVGVSQKT